MPGRWVRALFSNDSPFVETRSILIPNVLSSWNNSVRCSLAKKVEATPRSPARPVRPDTMNEVFGYVRKVIIDDVCDVRHVNAAGCHIRRDQHAIMPTLKPI